VDNAFSSATASEPFSGLVDIGERRLFAEVAGTGIPTVVLVLQLYLLRWAGLLQPLPHFSPDPGLLPVSQLRVNGLVGRKV
jgi:hypothetical protein